MEASEPHKLRALPIALKHKSETGIPESTVRYASVAQRHKIYQGLGTQELLQTLTV